MPAHGRMDARETEVENARSSSNVWRCVVEILGPNFSGFEDLELLDRVVVLFL